MFNGWRARSIFATVLICAVQVGCVSEDVKQTEDAVGGAGGSAGADGGSGVAEQAALAEAAQAPVVAAGTGEPAAATEAAADRERAAALPRARLGHLTAVPGEATRSALEGTALR